ncbi:MAG: molecular chaperone HtpG [Candidatus Marinimicrobia bacterium]|nr:molecular chaperone HtpG [Candidatus Neomarinimicrobiota bacterium]
MTENKGKKTNHRFKAELNRLLELIIHSLYKHPEIFLRELISNASDALNKARFLELTEKEIIDKDSEFCIKINVDKDKKLFTIEDSGIGMTRDELQNNIGTVANSGTLNYIKEMQEKGEPVNADMIGKFGVGFYSVFMVADEVIIETLSAKPGEQAYRWISDGKEKYTIEEIDKTSRGTKISFRLKEAQEEFAEEYRIKSIIKKYSNFVDFPIYINDKKENSVEALWRKADEELKPEELEEFYKFVSNDYEKPLDHLHLSMEGAVNFKALLFTPERAPLYLFRDINEKGLHLYNSRVFIEDNASEDLLPEYLRFIRGVVDTEDLPLNVSRETTQHSPVMGKIKSILTKKLLAQFEEWLKNDREKYEKFYKNFGQLLKTGLNSDFQNSDKIKKLLCFESTKTDDGKLVTFDEYIARMKEDQKEIYFLTGENKEIAARNPNLEYFRKNDIEVLYFTDPVDIFVMPNLYEYEGKNFVSIEKAEIDTTKSDDSSPEKLDKKEMKSILKTFKKILGEKVKDVVESKRLVDSPATLVVDKDGLDPQMERMMRAMNPEGTHFSQPKILEINPGHELIKNLAVLQADEKNSDTINDVINQLFEAALLIDGNLENPTDFISRMTSLMIKATK